jgi:hypothetical protein
MINRRFTETDFHRTCAKWMDLLEEIQTITLSKFPKSFII